MVYDNIGSYMTFYFSSPFSRHSHAEDFKTHFGVSPPLSIKDDVSNPETSI